MKTFLIIIDGPNGAGKSTVAKLLHKKLPFTAFIHWDTLKKLISDFEPTPRYHNIAADIGKAMIETYLKNGVNVIYEAFFGKREFVENALSAAKGEVEVLVYQIEAPLEVRKERIKTGFDRGDRKRMLTDEHIEKNDDFYFREKYKNAKVFDSYQMNTEEIVDNIIKDIEDNKF